MDFADSQLKEAKTISYNSLSNECGMLQSVIPQNLKLVLLTTGVSKKGKEETDSERPSSGPPPVKDEVSHSTPTSHNQDATVEGPKQVTITC